MDLPELYLSVGQEDETHVRVRLEAHFPGHIFTNDQLVSAQQVVSAVSPEGLTKAVVGQMFVDLGNALLNPAS